MSSTCPVQFVINSRTQLTTADVTGLSINLPTPGSQITVLVDPQNPQIAATPDWVGNNKPCISLAWMRDNHLFIGVALLIAGCVVTLFGLSRGPATERDMAGPDTTSDVPPLV